MNITPLAVGFIAYKYIFIHLLWFANQLFTGHHLVGFIVIYKFSWVVSSTKFITRIDFTNQHLVTIGVWRTHCKRKNVPFGKLTNLLKIATFIAKSW